jgi:hypothetical protein
MTEVEAPQPRAFQGDERVQTVGIREPVRFVSRLSVFDAQIAQRHRILPHTLGDDSARDMSKILLRDVDTSKRKWTYVMLFLTAAVRRSRPFVLR